MTKHKPSSARLIMYWWWFLVLVCAVGAAMGYGGSWWVTR